MTKVNPHKEEPTKQQLPWVLVLGPPTNFKAHYKEFSKKFNFIKPWESPLPLLQFLSANAKSVRAMLCTSATPVTADILQNVPQLRLIATTSVGVSHIDLPECRRRGISIANAADIFSEDVADYAVGLLIEVLRRVHRSNCSVKVKDLPMNTQHYPFSSKLGGKRVGIFGLGSIGLGVARRLKAFGCIISYNSRKLNPSVSYPFHSDICQLAADSDVLIICCVLTEKTRHMINREVLSALGEEGVVVNIARGAIIDEKELVRCLVKGEIAGAALDVFEDEPNVPPELLELDNVVLSPHSGVFTHESFQACYELMSGNLEAFFLDKPLLSPFMVNE